MAKPKKPRTASNTGYGILNPYGDMWTSEIFQTQDDAKDHLLRFWGSMPGGHDLIRFKIVRARQVAHFAGEVTPSVPNGVLPSDGDGIAECKDWSNP